MIRVHIYEFFPPPGRSYRMTKTRSPEGFCSFIPMQLSCRLSKHDSQPKLLKIEILGAVSERRKRDPFFNENVLSS